MPFRFDSFATRLFVKSQERAWQPAQIDYSQELDHWQALNQDEQELLLRLVDGFLVGERGVTHDLAPLLIAIRRERGRMEEEMFVAAQLFEEARHVEFFERWIDAALPGKLGQDIPYPKLTGDLFSVRLRETMEALLTDESPLAQIRALVIYHQYIEGVGAEASYPMYFEICQDGRFPALLEGITLIRRDEARHIAFGTHVIQRILEEHPELVSDWEAEIESYRPFVQEGARQTFAPFDGRDTPFGLVEEKYRNLYLENFEQQKRDVVSRELA